MDIKTLNEEFRNLFEYTEEPDAFETQSEREMEKQMEMEIDAAYKKNKDNAAEFFKKRNGGIKRIYSFLSKLKGVRDLRKGEGRPPYLACYISERDFNFFNDWNSKENNVLKECGLQMKAENASQGYNIYIY